MKKIFNAMAFIKEKENIGIEDLIDEYYEWAIYEKGDKEYILVKYLDYHTQDGMYNFTFKVNLDFGKYFEPLFYKNEDNDFKIKYYLLIKKDQILQYFELEGSTKFQGSAFPKDLSSSTIFKISISLENNTVEYRPYPFEYEKYKHTPIEMKHDLKVEEIKVQYKIKKYDETDWERLCNRRYEYVIKYENFEGTKDAFKKEIFEKDLPLEKFKKKFFNIKRKCAYCGIQEENLDLLFTKRSGRGNRLEYDRVISSEENGIDNTNYNIDNVELACYWCNNAKTDTFTAKEFKPIARGINQIWNKKLKKSTAINTNETIYFPENSDIWDKE